MVVLPEVALELHLNNLPRPDFLTFLGSNIQACGLRLLFFVEVMGIETVIVDSFNSLDFDSNFE